MPAGRKLVRRLLLAAGPAALALAAAPAAYRWLRPPEPRTVEEALGARPEPAPPPKEKPMPKPASKPNRLARESSPYLLQHADNPVDWHPWGEEAFRKAKAEDKPILLSIGYSTCHWCHVMERESFEDEGVAELLNAHFVSVKVDREERPDVDRIYMTAANAAGWGGGWPLNLFLTPELKPFFGGTYFPPDSRWGRPGFKELLARISELWKSRRADLAKDGDAVAAGLARHFAAAAEARPADPAWLERAARELLAAHDPERGGFGGAPKFPMPGFQALLLRAHARSGEAEPLEAALRTLREMARGGLRDHVGGGFHRYSVDAEWRVPHFEKMLYDNAQLAVNYLEAYQASKDSAFAKVAAETLDYVLRDLTHPEGGFYSAEDADSVPPELAGKKGAAKSEGAFYLWTEMELRALLGEDAELFLFRYGARPEGNAPEDPHGEFEGRNILWAEKSLAECAERFKAPEKALARRLDAARERLLEARNKRPRPHLDDKVLASWNGLMLSAFAKGAQALEDPRYLEAAARAAAFLRANLRDPKTGRLSHSWREGRRGPAGMADDYAFLAQGLLDLYEADFDPARLEWAMELVREQDALFRDPSDGGYWLTAADHDPRLLARVKEDADGVEPSAASVAALNLLRLAQFTGDKELRGRAEKTLARHGRAMAESPRAVPHMLIAADYALSQPRQIVIAGEPASPATLEMLRAVRSRFLPVKIVLRTGTDVQEKLAAFAPTLARMKAPPGRSTAYVCIHYACELPTSELSVLGDILDGKPRAE